MKPINIKNEIPHNEPSTNKQTDIKINENDSMDTLRTKFPKSNPFQMEFLSFLRNLR